MSHNKTLTQLFWFKAALVVPLIFGAIVAGLIVYHDSYFAGPACWTSDCINDAISRLKVPLTIMALVFPAVALVASNHRSAQTAAQIERTDLQIQKVDDVRINDRLQKEIDSAVIAYLYFRRLSRIAVLLASKTHVSFKNGNGQSKQRIEEIYDGWKYANNSEDCVRSIIFADNLVNGIGLIDTFDMYLQTARSKVYSQETEVFKREESNIFDILSSALETFTNFSRIHLETIRMENCKEEEYYNKNILKLDENAQKSLDTLKSLIRKSNKESDWDVGLRLTVTM
jgi:hypothetical protein